VPLSGCYYGRMRKKTAPTVHGETVYDGHCHVLNLEYLLLESVQILYDMVRGTYPLGSGAPLDHVQPVVPDFELNNPLEEAERLLAWVIQISKAAFHTQAANVRELRRVAAKVWGVPSLTIVPLMMDIYYLFSPPLAPATWEPPQPPRVATRRQAHARALTERVTSIVRGVRQRMATGDNGAVGRGGAIEKRIWAIVERVIDEKMKGAELPAPGFARTAGFVRQFHDIMALGETDARVRPFFALDARRPGAVEWVMNSGKVGPRGPFYGVKLYPRLGCHPGVPELAHLFRHCAKNGIPVTTHTSHRGFPDWFHVYADFGNPSGFERVLAENRHLRIDFAHFGDRPSYQGPGRDWGARIASLMAEHEGVYSDLSCYTHDSALDTWEKTYAPLDHVRERTMFGSDFNVLFFTEPGMTAENYYARFLSRFQGEALDRMACEVPARFLGS